MIYMNIRLQDFLKGCSQGVWWSLWFNLKSLLGKDSTSS